MHGPGFWELLALGVLALLIFGPDRLPGMAYKAGEFIAKFRSEAAGTLNELKAAAELEGFNEVARGLRETSDDLRRTAADVRGGLDVRSDVEDAVKPRSAPMATAAPDVAPPFDPDTP